MKTWILHACVFLAGAGLAAFAVPQDRGEKKHGLEAAYDDLGLTATVAEDLKKLDAAVAPECATLGEKRRALYAEMKKDPCHRAEVERLAADLAAARARIQKHVLDHLLDVRARLTPEQREALFSRLAGASEKR